MRAEHKRLKEIYERTVLNEKYLEQDYFESINKTSEMLLKKIHKMVQFESNKIAKANKTKNINVEKDISREIRNGLQDLY